MSKIKFIVYIYIYLHEKSYISAKIGAVKIHTQSFCYLQNSANVQSDSREPLFILTSLTSRGPMLLLECKLHYVSVGYYRAFSKYTRNVNIKEQSLKGKMLL